MEGWIAGVAVLMVAMIGGCNMKNVQTRADAAVELHKAGADPLDIPCAIGDGTERYCELRAATKALVTKP